MDDQLPPFARPAACQAHLRILATTDLHVQILPYDYYADRPAAGGSLANAAALISRLRTEAPNSLLLDNGDFLQGNPLGDFVAETRRTAADAPHPMIGAMNALDYDAVTLGNHEFNYGLDFLTHCLAAARFPVISANVVTRAGVSPAEDETLLPPFVVLDRTIADAQGQSHPIRIGVIGLLPPQILIWDRALLAGRVTSRGIVETAAAHLPRILAAGADLVIALCHSGIGSAMIEPEAENAATALAMLPGIDIVVSGHSHLVFPGAGFPPDPAIDADKGALAGKPAVMAGSFGSHLGVIDLVLDRAAGRWRPVAASARAQPVLVGDDPPGASQRAVEAVAAGDHLGTLAHIRRPVGYSEHPLNSYFGQMPGNAYLALVAQAQQRHIADALRGRTHADLPLLSAVAPFKMGGRGGPGYYTDVPAGPLALRHVADLYVYPNTIRALLITGADLLTWLDRASSVFNTLIPGVPDQMLMDPAMPSSHFDVIHGVTWAIDLASPAGSGALRIRDLSHAGSPIRPEDRFVVATNNYRAAISSDELGCITVFEEPRMIRDILRQYITETDTIRPTAVPTFRFQPALDTSALFDTSPRAFAHLPELTGVSVENAGEGAPGFMRFRLRL